MSLYKSRGVDLDARNKNVYPALQGAIRYDWSSGLYAGNWNSTGRFGESRLEVDLYAGYMGKLHDDLGFDVGYVHYLYPGEGSWNCGELYAGLNYGNASLYLYRGMRSEVNRGNLYAQLTYKHPLTEQLSLTAGLGHLNYDAPQLRSRTDASLGLEYQLHEKTTLSMQVQSANRKNVALHHAHDTRLVFGVRTSF